MRSAERRKVNVLEMKCLRSLVEVSLMDRVRNEEVRIELKGKGKVIYGQEPPVEYLLPQNVGSIINYLQ